MKTINHPFIFQRDIACDIEKEFLLKSVNLLLNMLCRSM
jgi:hypothetical protein